MCVRVSYPFEAAREVQLWICNKGGAGEVVYLSHEVDFDKVVITDIRVTCYRRVDISGTAKEGAPTGPPMIMPTCHQGGGN